MTTSQARPSTADQFALNAYLVKNYESTIPIGKKAVQKLVYLCQDLYRVPTGYHFTLYTFGPFSRDLSADIDILSNLDVISVKYDDDHDAFHISPGTRCDKYIREGSRFIASNEEKIVRLLKQFRNRTARDLELSATMLYLIGHSPQGRNSDEDTVGKLLQLKPKYTKKEARARLSELKEFVHKS